ncbi:MAG: CHAT domain-containing protein [Promethearchaeota archaeon]
MVFSRNKKTRLKSVLEQLLRYLAEHPAPKDSAELLDTSIKKVITNLKHPDTTIETVTPTIMDIIEILYGLPLTEKLRRISDQLFNLTGILKDPEFLQKLTKEKQVEKKEEERSGFFARRQKKGRRASDGVPYKEEAEEELLAEDRPDIPEKPVPKLRDVTIPSDDKLDDLESAMTELEDIKEEIDLVEEAKAALEDEVYEEREDDAWDVTMGEDYDDWEDDEEDDTGIAEGEIDDILKEAGEVETSTEADLDRRVELKQRERPLQEQLSQERLDEIIKDTEKEKGSGPKKKTKREEEPMEPSEPEPAPDLEPVISGEEIVDERKVTSGKAEPVTGASELPPPPAAPKPSSQPVPSDKPKPPPRPRLGRLSRRRRPKTLQRFGDISCPLRMQLKKQYNVEVCVRASKERVKGVSVGIQVAVPKSPQEVPMIEVFVLAPGFDITGEVRRPLEIPVEHKDSETLIFKMTPEALGEKYVFVEFYQHGKLLGRSVITVQVEDKLKGKPPLESKAFSLKTFTADEVDLDATLRIVKFENKFFFSLFTRHSAAVVDPASMFGVRELDTDQIESLKALMRHSAFKKQQTEAEETLKNLGLIVYKLIPSKMRETIEHVDPQFLLIETGDMFVPWELAYDGEDFWAIKYSLGKRIFDETSDFRAPPLCFGTTTLKSAIVSSSAEDLKFAEKEVEMFEKFAQTKRLDLQKIIANRKQAVQALKEGVDLWHYVGHGEFDVINPQNSALLLNPPLSAAEISKIAVQGFPVIFANACEAGTLQKETYGVAGIARSFLGSGAIAFLGPLWEIPDELAAEFATGFYQRLLFEGKNIGLAIRETKLVLKDKFPGVLWATFSLFGDPTLRICTPLSSS